MKIPIPAASISIIEMHERVIIGIKELNAIMEPQLSQQLNGFQ